MRRFAIVNGDDFGLSPGINRGIIEAHQLGILTSASLIATGEAFDDAVALAHQFPNLSIGVHLALTEGTPVLSPEKLPSLVGSRGLFLPSPGALFIKWLKDGLQLREVQQELAAQIEKILAHKLRIDKLDSHMHLHMLPGIFRVVLALAKQYQIRAIRLPGEAILSHGKVSEARGLWKRAVLAWLTSVQRRHVARTDLLTPDRFCGLAVSGSLGEHDLLRILQRLQPGLTEIMVHPGYRDATLAGWPRSRRYERERELQALLSRRVKRCIAELGITLTNYREVGSEGMS